MMHRGGERGVALIFVLWLLVLLGTIAADVATHARSETAILSTLRSRTVARYSAESGVLAATVRIEELLDTARSLPQRIGLLRELDAQLASLRDVDLGSARFSVAVLDVNARLDLNRADEPSLRALFQQFTTPQRAEAAVAALKRAPLHRLSELLDVPGIDDSLALAVAPYVTVWGDGPVNVNSASEPVLAALPGIGAAVARSIVRRRDMGEVFTSPDLARPAARPDVPIPVVNPLLSVIPSRLLIVSRGWERGHPLTHEIQAVYALVGGRLVLQSSQERDL